ncbi:MAG: HAMP domain-containing protein [Chloroflexi bacterium]|nr:HAMP domain-containing protein [Chloroflexota bacterium]
MKLDKIWAWFWAFTGSASINVKIMGIVLILILIFGLGITFQVRNSLTTTLTDELEKQGIAITKNVAAYSTELILTGNHYDLYQIIKDTVESEEAVRYAMVLDINGNIITHSFSGGIPVGLATANQIGADADFQLVRLDTNEGLILDIAVPIFGGRAGIARVGMSTHSLHEMVAILTGRWLIITGVVSLVGLLAAYLLTSVLTRPIKHLVEVTKAIARGDLKLKAPVWAPDEIGRLGIAFNDMTDSLAKSRTESEAFHDELLRRNRELSVLNTISTEISGSRELTDIMRRSLVKVLGFINLKAGWVSILSDNGERAITVCHTGLSPAMVRKIASHDLSACRCREAIDQKLPIVVSDNEGICPVLHDRLANRETMCCHVAVPLISKSHVLGLLHIASSEPSRLTPENINLLGSIGYQMGVAIENANLWKELERKEKIRGYVLEEIISAQEAERKRIARELHDQTGQSLTSLMVGLKMLETGSQQEIQQRITDMRQLTTQTLEEVHNLALELRPSSLDDLGLTAVLKQYAAEYAGKFGVNTEFQAIGFGQRLLSPEMEIAIYRIVQEALTNVAKHAEAKKVSVLLEVRDSSVVAIVEDDGKGFDIKRDLGLTSVQNQLGLYGMYERAELIGGRITIESNPGMGTTVFVEVPLSGNGS